MSAGRKARRAFEKRARAEEKPRAVFSVTMQKDGRIRESADIALQDGRVMLNAIRKLLAEFEHRVRQHDVKTPRGALPQTAAAKYFANKAEPAEETT